MDRRLPAIVDAAGSIEADNFIIDGELIGNGDFYDTPSAIQRAEVCVVAFDNMHLNGQDTRMLPLLERRILLQGLLEDDSSIIFLQGVS